MSTRLIAVINNQIIENIKINIILKRIYSFVKGFYFLTLNQSTNN